MASQIGRRRHRVAWAVAGAIVLVGAVLALVLAAINGPNEGADPQPPTGHESSDPSPTPLGADGVVDLGVSDRGWVPEPLTRDADAYVPAALEAAGTFDARLATRDEWVSWLETWFTLSPLYEDPQDAFNQMVGYQAELDHAVLLPQSVWDDLARENGRVTARVVGDIDFNQLPEMVHARMWTATADVVMTYTRDADGDEVSYDETVRVSVQVVCGGESIPTPGSAQQAGDCKVVRFFDEAVN